MLLFAGIIGAGSTGCSFEPTEGKGGDGEGGPVEETSIPVRVIPVSTRDISSYLTSTATIEAEDWVDVHSEVRGFVRRIAKEEGDEVKAGDLMAKLRDDDQAIAEKKARVNLEKLKDDLKKAEGQYSKGLIPEDTLLLRRFEYRQAELEWQSTRLALERTEIRAPIAGIVTAREIRRGEWIRADAKVFTVVDFQSLIAKIFVPEKDIRRVAVGNAARILSDSFPEEVFRGKVERLNPVVDSKSGTVKVTIAVENRSSHLRPGMFVRIRLVLDTHKDAVAIPKKAVFYERNAPNAFVVVDGAGEKRSLRLGYADADSIEVLSGLRSGELLIVEGHQGLKEGAKVKVVP
jgi:RND family efflux transporter MFP subunit